MYVDTKIAFITIDPPIARSVASCGTSAKAP